jgi:hypothetical protein
MDRKTFYHVPGSRSGFDSATPPDIDDIYASRNVPIVPPHGGKSPSPRHRTNRQSSSEKQRRRRREQREREHRERERALHRERREKRQMREQRQKNVLTKSEEDFRTFIRNKPKKPARPVVSGGLCAAEALEGVVDTRDIVWIPSFPTVVLADSTHKDESQSHKKRKGFIPRPASFDKEWTLRDRDVTAQELVLRFFKFFRRIFLSIL